MTTSTLPTVHAPATRRHPDPAARWRVADVQALYDLPFVNLLFTAQNVHREHFDPNEVQLSTLLSIKTGGCPEDCAYCPQSASFDTGVEASKLMSLAEVVQAAQAAKAQGATRFCMGAACAARRRATSNASARWCARSAPSAWRPA